MDRSVVEGAERVDADGSRRPAFSVNILIWRVNFYVPMIVWISSTFDRSI